MSDNSFLPGLAAWSKALGGRETPFLNEIKKSPLRGQRPIIGYTKDRRRFVHHLARIGWRLQHRMARLVPVEVCDEYGDCTQYWERNHWKWVWAAGQRSALLAPQPIYDMDWVDPNPPTTMRWGWSAIEEKPEVDFNYFADMERRKDGAHLRTRGRTAGDPADQKTTPPD